MVSRIEIALAGLLGIALLLGVDNQQQILRAKKRGNERRKEVELLNARTREVNATAVMNDFSASRAVMIHRIWYMDNFSLRNPDVRSLRAKRAVRSDREIRLEGNVTLQRYDDSVFEAHKVFYDTRRKTLRSVGPFHGYRGEDFVRGINFVYEVIPQRTYGEKVFAHYRLTEGTKGLR